MAFNAPIHSIGWIHLGLIFYYFWWAIYSSLFLHYLTNMFFVSSTTLLYFSFTHSKPSVHKFLPMHPILTHSLRHYKSFYPWHLLKTILTIIILYHNSYGVFWLTFSTFKIRQLQNNTYSIILFINFTLIKFYTFGIDFTGMTLIYPCFFVSVALERLSYNDPGLSHLT